MVRMVVWVNVAKGSLTNFIHSVQSTNRGGMILLSLVSILYYPLVCRCLPVQRGKVKPQRYRVDNDPSVINQSINFSTERSPCEDNHHHPPRKLR